MPPSSHVRRLVAQERDYAEKQEMQAKGWVDLCLLEMDLDEMREREQRR